MTDIEQWLANPADYETGRQLYERYGTFPRLKATLQRGGDCDTNWGYLIYELDKIKHLGGPAAAALIPTCPPNNIPADEPVLGSKSLQQNQTIDDGYEQLPNQVRALVDEWKSLYKVSVHFHSQLSVVQTDEERGKLAMDILDNFDRIHELWDQLEYYKQNQKLPEPPAPKTTLIDRTDTVAVMKRINNLMSYISRAAKRGQGEEKILAWQQEKAELEALVANQ